MRLPPRLFVGAQTISLACALGLATASAASGCGTQRLKGLSSGSGATSTTGGKTTSASSGGGEGGQGGAGGAGGAGGTGGTGGMPAPTGPIGQVGQACWPKGALGCAGHAQAHKLVCGPDAKWAANGDCMGNTRCDTEEGPKQGTCQPVVPACANKSPGDVVCDMAARVQCGPDLVTSDFIEQCDPACVAGQCAQCWPGDIQCNGNTPQTCNPAGTFQNDPPCVGQTCVNGNCTGVCGPTDKQCAGNKPQSCDATGQWQDEPACSIEAPVCTLGSCVGHSCLNLPETCGPNADEHCCAGSVLSGGMFNRSNFIAYPATVNDFWLDRFEVTVGRFRKFLEAYPGSKPQAGAGAHPAIPGSGWDPAWDAHLPADQAALKSSLKCEVQYKTWTDMPADHENLPINCVSWYTAFAFCAWDGERLATEAEWNYAAAGGNEQRLYPWGAAMPDPMHAVYDCTGDGSLPAMCAFSDILNVGQKPAGDGRWGQADLAGSVWEWNLDWYHDPYAVPCDNCSNLVDPGATHRGIRGGAFSHQGLGLLTENRFHADPAIAQNTIGIRCAKTP